jgi:hypothetical protein
MTRFGEFGALGVGVGLAAGLTPACLKIPDAEPPSDSEVATSVVSGALNNTSGSSVALGAPTVPRRAPFEKLLDTVNPIGTAYAADWSCSGGSLAPKFSGPGEYSYTPVSCKVTWGNGRVASSEWSGPFGLAYGSSCDSTTPFVDTQSAGCAVTRTTHAGGETRTITGPDGNAYAISHDTNGSGSGWDSAVSPAPSNAGLVLTCSSSGCAGGGTLVVSGSHLSGTVTIDGKSTKIWDHTVSTTAGGITVTGHGSGRIVSGAVTVQHNLARYTATATFDSVGYSDPGCCFPTSGSVSTTFSEGPDTGKTETLTFSPFCGEATLTTASGEKEAITLQQCL